MASGRAQQFLSTRFEDVHQIHGLHIIYEENRVRPGRTLFSNVLKGIAAVPDQIGAYFKMLEDFRPEVVISDFESWTYLYGKNHGLPILSIDNMQSSTADPPRRSSTSRDRVPLSDFVKQSG